MDAAQRILTARDANPLFEPCLVRLKILDWLPQDDTFAFFNTCRAFQQTVLQHNQQAAASPELGLVARPVRRPPNEHILSSLALVQWALASTQYRSSSARRTDVRCFRRLISGRICGGICALAADPPFWPSPYGPALRPVEVASR